MIPSPRLRTRLITCDVCTFQFEWAGPHGGNPAKTCPDCREQIRTHPRVNTADQNRRLLGDYDMARELVNLRLAVEMATASLRMGLPAQALRCLLPVSAPLR